MKLNSSVAALAVGALLAASCATLSENIDVRKTLAECQYNLADLDVKDVKFSSGIVVSEVDFVAKLKITNPTKHDAALDHAVFDFFLDDQAVGHAEHQRFTLVKAGQSAVEPLQVGVPLEGVLATLGHRPATLKVKAQLWVTLVVAGKAWKTPLVVPVEFETPVPWKKIDQAIEKQKAALAKKAGKAAGDLLKKVTKP